MLPSTLNVRWGLALLLPKPAHDRHSDAVFLIRHPLLSRPIYCRSHFVIQSTECFPLHTSCALVGLSLLLSTPIIAVVEQICLSTQVSAGLHAALVGAIMVLNLSLNLALTRPPRRLSCNGKEKSGNWGTPRSLLFLYGLSYDCLEAFLCITCMFSFSTT